MLYTLYFPSFLDCQWFMACCCKFLHTWWIKLCSCGLFMPTQASVSVAIFQSLMFFFFSLDELQMRAVEDLSITMSDRTPESHSCPQTTQRRKRRKRVSLLGIETPTSRRNRRVNTHSHYVWSNWRQLRLKRNISCIWRTLNIIVYRASCCSNHHDAFAINPLVEVAI